MNISTEGIDTIKIEGNKIILTYANDNFAEDAMAKFSKKNQEFINKLYPNGVF